MADKTGKSNPITTLETILGHTFSNKTLVFEALTHPSLEGEDNYQRLEFLGDRVLGVVMANLLFATFPKDPEGRLSRRFAALVRKETLCEVALELKIPPLVRMSETMIKNDGRKSAAVLADVVEALIGALYLDGGLKAAEDFIAKAWEGRLNDGTVTKDPKTGLQEWAQGRGLPLPTYETVERTGPDHAPSFSIKVSVKGKGSAIGKGASKRLAETEAASKLLSQVKKA